jgi:hypothetical protein
MPSQEHRLIARDELAVLIKEQNPLWQVTYDGTLAALKKKFTEMSDEQHRNVVVQVMADPETFEMTVMMDEKSSDGSVKKTPVNAVYVGGKPYEDCNLAWVATLGFRVHDSDFYVLMRDVKVCSAFPEDKQNSAVVLCLDDAR